MTIPFPPENDTATQLALGRPRLLHRIRARQRATRLLIAGGVLAAAACGTAATLVVAQAGDEPIATMVTCYAHADLSSFSSSGAAARTEGQPFEVASLEAKTAMCGFVWKAGLAEAAANGEQWPDVDPNTSTLPVPPLAFCTLPNGTSGGFPIEAPATTPAQVCDRLGLALLG